MIKAVIFDMFETLVTLFVGRTYFSENIAQDFGIPLDSFRKAWHSNEHERTIGKYTMKEGVELTLKATGAWSKENVELVVRKRRQALEDTFSAIPPESIKLLQTLHQKGLKVGLITNTFSDECEIIKQSPLYPLFDATMISYETGLCKPDPQVYKAIIEKLDVSPQESICTPEKCLLKAQECLYVGDGGSRELYGARNAGMQALQCTWFSKLAFEPHIPCPPLADFPQAKSQMDVLDYISK